ncbi:hypothetical protein KM043_002420 [Ampulex compressa]|nr:hypothetical protein KM043_002420 [Ampulex compressa]
MVFGRHSIDIWLDLINPSRLEQLNVQLVKRRLLSRGGLAPAFNPVYLAAQFRPPAFRSIKGQRNLRDPPSDCRAIKRSGPSPDLSVLRLIHQLR